MIENNILMLLMAQSINNLSLPGPKILTFVYHKLFPKLYKYFTNSLQILLVNLMEKLMFINLGLFVFKLKIC